MDIDIIHRGGRLGVTGSCHELRLDQRVYDNRKTRKQRFEHALRDGGHVVLDGEKIAIRAGIHTISGYSAHADCHDLARFITRMRHLPSEVRLIHGEKAASNALAERLVNETGGRVRIIP